ncbi:MAG TPA: hypothetical protein VGO59_14750 [Verrucomicrobiae bacterium]
MKTQHGRATLQARSSCAASGICAADTNRNRAAPISITNSDGGAGESNSTWTKAGDALARSHRARQAQKVV